VKKIVADPKGAENAGREGFDLTVQKLNPFKKPASEQFDQWGTPRIRPAKRKK
jgi:hypothetical protein